MKKLLLILLCLPMIGFGQMIGCLKNIYVSVDKESCLERIACCEIKEYLHGYSKGEKLRVERNDIHIQITKPIGYKQSHSSYSEDAINLLKSYENKDLGSVIQLYVTESPKKITKNQILRVLEDYSSKFESYLNNKRMNMLSSRIVYFDTYPALEVISETFNKKQKQVNYITFYNNNYINFLCASFPNSFEYLYPLFNKIKSKIYIVSNSEIKDYTSDHYNLWSNLSAMGDYTKTYIDWSVQYNEIIEQRNLFKLMEEDIRCFHYTKEGFESFKNKYFSKK